MNSVASNFLQKHHSQVSTQRIQGLFIDLELRSCKRSWVFLPPACCTHLKKRWHSHGNVRTGWSFTRFIRSQNKSSLFGTTYFKHLPDDLGQA